MKPVYMRATSTNQVLDVNGDILEADGFDPNFYGPGPAAKIDEIWQSGEYFWKLSEEGDHEWHGPFDTLMDAMVNVIETTEVCSDTSGKVRDT